MVKKRIERLNSLLKEVISEVVSQDVRNPHVAQLVTITRVDISNDLHHAKVFISVIGSDQDKEQTIEALQSAAGFIAVQSSKKVVMRYFPALNFKLDSSVDQHLRIDAVLGQIHEEQNSRKQNTIDQNHAE
ncbi:MAG TPA: 30S ribosome-binding factor RbfA [Rhabdochlamydiaceae bacterium]|nr:30S ribosome-binding factor RbfA [Rhabdochlamydiaceae bacterium]